MAAIKANAMHQNSVLAAIFPASGRGEFLIGAPQIDGAEIELSSKKKLVILVIVKATSGVGVFVF